MVWRGHTLVQAVFPEKVPAMNASISHATWLDVLDSPHFIYIYTYTPMSFICIYMSYMCDSPINWIPKEREEVQDGREGEHCAFFSP